MAARYLLPHKFKKIGAFLFPLGFIGWIAGQMGVFTNPLFFITGDNKNGYTLNNNPTAFYHLPNVLFLVISFFSFLTGLYFISFSKERKEDEFISKIRLESFQLSALVQLVFFMLTSVIMFVLRTEPVGDTGWLSFILISVLLFWLFYISRFNYLLHWRKGASTN
jgi:uncharacterized membrane protein